MPAPPSVEFPAFDSSNPVKPSPRPPHLPFRRISLPTAPQVIKHQSTGSLTSFDSKPDAGSASASAAAAMGSNVAKKKKSRPVPPQATGRTVSRRPVDNARESKRRKVIHEFYETERVYVDGLELIYSHFLSPIIASLDMPYPLLTREELTAVFSNFIDIWNLHRSFFSSLTTLLEIRPSPAPQPPPPLLSPLLLSHFPYLSLYTPFITSFPTSLSMLTSLITPGSAAYKAPFAIFINTQQEHPRCAKLTIRDWLLTIVQRCPRYLLLLKDLIGCTVPDDPEYTQLTSVHSLVSKITLSLNASLATHAQTLSLLSLQRSTSSLPQNPPLYFVYPGRTLLKRGELVMVERSKTERREFLLFSDCLVWLARVGSPGTSVSVWDVGGGVGGRAGDEGSSTAIGEDEEGFKPGLARSRSKSENELPRLKAREAPPSPARKAVRHSVNPAGLASMTEEQNKWEYKGMAALIDLEVVVLQKRVAVDIGEGGERKLEVLSPEGSFEVYAVSEADRDAWSTAIRDAKAALLVSVNITHPDSTLTSSFSKKHIRRCLQALPFAPTDERLGTLREHYLPANSSLHSSGNDVRKERRAHVDHWVPAIWIPDGKTEGCMRCGKAFGWRRRRHHCRLCGRCVCHACSGKTFFVSDLAAKDSTKAARACDACYDTVFPLLEPPTHSNSSTFSSAYQPSPDMVASPTTSTLTGFPSWMTLTGPGVAASTTEALMAIDRMDLRIEDEVDGGEGDMTPDVEGDVRHERVKVRRASLRPRSYHQILEDFQTQEDMGTKGDHVHMVSPEPVVEVGTDPLPSSRRQGVVSSSAVDLSGREREDTARRHKRFSVPAVALQTTSVIAQSGGSGGRSGRKDGKRFSLVLGKGNEAKTRSANTGMGDGSGKDGLAKGVAASKLSELLGRGRKAAK